MMHRPVATGMRAASRIGSSRRLASLFPFRALLPQAALRTTRARAVTHNACLPLSRSVPRLHPALHSTLASSPSSSVSTASALFSSTARRASFTSADLTLVGLNTLSSDLHKQMGDLHQRTFGDWISWSDLSERHLPNEEIFALLNHKTQAAQGKLLAYAVFRHFPTSNTFLRFLVVDDEHRGRGIGSAAWPLLLRHAATKGYRIMCWDIEHPHQVALSDSERSVRLQRLKLYQRVGGTVLPIDDFGNPHGDEGQEVPMMLFAQRTDGTNKPLADTPAELAQLSQEIRRDIDLYRWHREQPVPLTIPLMKASG
jgi:GNAT superfamily N-acetyltransferase